MKWERTEVSSQTVRDLAAKYGCDLLVASILARRGLVEGERIRFFLEDDPRHLHNPFLLPAMEDAVDRVLAAVDEGEKVLVSGDRDVDGITGTTLVVGALQALGLDVSWRVPTGDESYGLSVAAVEEFAAQSGTLIVTVDCGISNAEEVQRASELGIDVIILDHHVPPERIPDAAAVVNPKLRDSPYPFRDLAGCGVAYKFSSALRFARSHLYKEPICLLAARPANEAIEVEAVKLRNLAVVDRIVETVVPGMVDIQRTRLLPFLEGQQILVWDAPLQQRILQKAFGGGVEFSLLDVSGEIGSAMPQVVGKSLLRLKELSRIARYDARSSTELDAFINVFVSFARKKERLFGDADLAELQLVALGTLADLMPLRDENRILVRTGLASIAAGPRPGLSDLFMSLGLAGRRVGGTELSWQVCPAINATGRMGTADVAVRLLTEEDRSERGRLAERVVALNDERRKLGSEVWTVLEAPAEESLAEMDGKLVLVGHEGLHRGITGIMASRLVGRYKVPAVAVSLSGKEIAVGSVRSARGYDVRAMLDQCADLFIDYGGHDYAAGFSLPKDRWEELRTRMASVAATMELGAEEDEETLRIDAELPASYMTPELLSVVDRFEPYGEDNKPLIFVARNLRIEKLDLMGKTAKNHVKLTLDCGAYKWPAVFWQAADRVVPGGDREAGQFYERDIVDVAFRVSRNFFNGSETPQLIVSDIRRSEEGAGQ